MVNFQNLSYFWWSDGWFLLRHQNGSSWGFHHHLLYRFSFVSVTICNLLDPSASFNAPKLVVVQPKKPTPIIGNDPTMASEISLGAKDSSWEASEAFSLKVCSGALPWGLVFKKESPEEILHPAEYESCGHILHSLTVGSSLTWTPGVICSQIVWRWSDVWFVFLVCLCLFVRFYQRWKSSMMPDLWENTAMSWIPGLISPQRSSYILEHFPKKQKKKWLAPSTFRQEYGAYVLGFRLLGKAAGEYLFCSYTHRFMGVWRVGYQRDNRVDQLEGSVVKSILWSVEWCVG